MGGSKPQVHVLYVGLYKKLCHDVSCEEVCTRMCMIVYVVRFPIQYLFYVVFLQLWIAYLIPESLWMWGATRLNNALRRQAHHRIRRRSGSRTRHRSGGQRLTSSSSTDPISASSSLETFQGAGTELLPDSKPTSPQHR